MARWGRFIHHHTWWTLGLSGVVLATSIFFLLRGGDLKNPRSLNLEAGRASDLIDSQLPHGGAGSSFNLLFVGKGGNLKATDPQFEDAMNRALQPLTRDSRVARVVTPFSGDATIAPTLTAANLGSAIAIIDLKDAGSKSRRYYPELREKVQSDKLQVLGFDGQADNSAFDQQLALDLQHAELISIPLTIVLLLLVFGALVAAGLPLVVGIVSIVGGVGGIYLIAGVTDVSSYAENVVTLIGLGVSIDYSLFIVNRFREELAGGASREEALATTMATAGRAITFSGITVAVGLSGMLFYGGSFLPSMGLAGAIVVAIAVFYSLTLLPALLALLGPRINRLTVPISATGSRQGWHRLAMAVMRRPLVVLVPTVAFIFLAGLPFFHLRMANSGIDALPTTSEVVRAHDVVKQQFPSRDQTQVAVVANFPATALTAARVGALYDYSRRLRAIPGVEKVTSIVDLDPRLDRAAYIRLYSATPPPALPPGMADAVHQTVGKHIVLLTAITRPVEESDGARQVVKSIRAQRAVGDGQVLVTGQSAFDLDIVDFIISRTPAAVAFIVVVTMVVLFLLLGSVLLPVKAVVMNFLSLSASFGALVWIFQDGHFTHLLGFRAQSVDPSIPVLLFCIVFGLSMDYEVLLMSRMKEEWERTRDNRHAVAQGLELSGRLVTGAAAIMVVVFLGFGLAQVLLIKELGIGMAIAVAIDATLVRALIVPATMRLLGNLNWWAPGPVERLYRRMGLGEAAQPRRAEVEPAA